MIEIWMEIHLVSDNNCNIVNLQCIFTQGVTNNVKLLVVLMTLHGCFTIGIEQFK